MNNQYYLVKGLNKLAQGWHEAGEDAVARSIYRYIIRLQNNNPETFGAEVAEFSAIMQDYEALNLNHSTKHTSNEKELVHN